MYTKSNFSGIYTLGPKNVASLFRHNSGIHGSTLTIFGIMLLRK